MSLFGVIARLGVFLVALFAILVGCLIADVPGQLGLWRYLDKNPFFQGVVPLIHDGEWKFNHSTLGPEALAGRTVLVTGANSGLGLGTVYYLAQHGASVILACRSKKSCDEAINAVKKENSQAALTSVVLDLSSFASIKRAAEEVIRTTPKLNSLILNAGFAFAPYALTEDGLESHIGVNHFGHAYLVRLLEPLLKQSASKELPATIVSVSSAKHMESYPEGVRLSVAALNDPKQYDKNLAYGQSKLANVLYAQSLAERLRPSGILVNSLHPGVVETTALSKYVNDTINDLQASHPAVINVLTKTGLLARVRSFLSKTMWNQNDGALTQAYLAVSPEVLNKRVHGKYFHPVAREAVPCQKHATNSTLQKGLWDLTEEVIAAHAK